MNGIEKGTDTNSGCTQVVDLINFQAGIQFFSGRKDILYLIGGYRVQTTAKRVQLDHIQVISCFYKACSGIEAGVIHPLIGNHKGSVRSAQMGYTVFRKDCKTKGSNHFRNTMMDFRINMVGAACKDNTTHMVLFHITQGFFPFFHDILTCFDQFLPGFSDSSRNFSCRKLGKFTNQSMLQGSHVLKGQERVTQQRRVVADFFHIVFDIFRIRGDDRTVVVITCAFHFVTFIEDGRVENKIYLLLQEPFNMAVA